MDGGFRYLPDPLPARDYLASNPELARAWIAPADRALWRTSLPALASLLAAVALAGVTLGWRGAIVAAIAGASAAVAAASAVAGAVACSAAAHYERLLTFVNWQAECDRRVVDALVCDPATRERALAVCRAHGVRCYEPPPGTDAPS